MRSYWNQVSLKFLLPVMLVTMLTCASAFSMAEEHQTTEYRIKAAFLYNFSRFVTWPDHEKRAGESFNLCVLGDNPFGKLLNSITGKPVHSRSLKISLIDNVEQAQACQIIFISTSAAGDLPRLIAALEGNPTLTVSDIDGFTNQGGIIQFKLVNNKVQFNINIDAASLAGLTVSSKLLSLATVVRNAEQTGP